MVFLIYLLPELWGRMPDGLFRKEVFEQRNSEWLGSIKVSTPPNNWVFSLLASVLVTVAIFFLVFGHFTRRQSVTGELVPSLGLLNVTASSAGNVTQTYVRPGDIVKSGQALLALSGDVDSSTMGLIDALVMQSLDGQKNLLQQDIVDQDQLAAVQMTDLQDKLASLKSQLAEIDSQITIQNEQVSTTVAVLQKFNEAGNGGFVSGLQMQQQKGFVFSAQAELKELDRDRDQITQQIDDTEQQLRQVPITQATQNNDTQAKLANIEQSLAKTAAGRSIVLRAPFAGVVSAMIVEPGEAITAGEPVVSITPAGANLVAQLLVPSAAIGFIHPQNLLKLRYDAFPYQEFGEASGRVMSISKSALTPSEVAGLTEQRTDEPLYLVDVALDHQTIGVYGQQTPLLAGLKLQASIMLDRRRLIQWVFEPIYNAGRGMFGASS